MKTVKSLSSYPADTARRLRALVEKSGLSDQEFGSAMGFSKGYVSRILSGKIKPSREFLERLAEVHHVNLNDVISPFETVETAYVELYGQEAAAGVGVEIDSSAESCFLPIPMAHLKGRRPENLAALTVKGDSMVDEHIADGDYVIFDRNETGGEHIFVVRVGSTLLVKRVLYDDIRREIRLVSANKAAGRIYEDRVYQGEECEAVQVLGRVVDCIHRMG
jgi:phage repressor protein C with HTH and peptisase S24 domain